MKGADRVRSVVADMFAMVVFSFVTGMLIEIFVSGMSFEQSLASRLLSIPVNILIAWPYGVFRDNVLRFATRQFPFRMTKRVADFFAYVVFQSPVYAAILFTVGAEPNQILTAVASNALVSGILGIVYGVFLEKCRRFFKVQLVAMPVGG
ncbi:L-alanine exporter AlaE [Enterovibrio nigricans]|uniref:L-alanine exporter AlaE n=1 Tax=Enterovibrio nigricans DSM 22720 TaxID=1121868 RepID=A0A1T4VVR7_9GAMM|nr:L-alanine exporter AlaE [Enterovibrio nigricans]SKA68918.1 L-alanine exporter [Enterovibrio nigricans DSM 22720]